ncbi:alpha/beta fold hydrolase [Kineosporia succinea]|uniref:Pimeloyl-ACP methyl ester carboxylesterase n=1 Tax=Kineosporia succinea TaxID=84632 RepID=A0ABT9PCR9_9ACTN|nr:alpha/beta hydrolase [Kineosporia succinea]MDP9830498.1 pimeloyl-ACP methyl ester carboxylesterase [Kineosporia succinea]
MITVTSADGTPIACSRTGEGPALVLVDGAFGHRDFGPNPALAKLLARDFTVWTYDRRGRGGSGDQPVFSPEREYEDLAAVVKEAGDAFVYGISSGAALVLDAVAHGVPAARVAVFEAPFIVDGSRPPVPADHQEQLTALLARGRRGAVVSWFMRRGVGLPAPLVAFMHVMPAWPKLKRLAHTVPYDLAHLGDAASGRPLEPSRWSGLQAPVLVVDGGRSPATMRTAMAALAQALPDAGHRTLPGQTHIVKPAALAPVLAEFFRR